MKQIMIAGLIVLTLILAPFFLFREPVEAWAVEWLHHPLQQKGMTAAVVMLLLAMDLLLPVPSSIVSTASGAFLGWAGGALASFAGMTAGCIFGYFLGRYSGETTRWINADTLKRLAQYFARTGDWTLILTRPVPVLAEASVIFAGLGRMRFSTFLLYSSVSNLAISLAYASIGAYAVTINSFLLAFGVAVLIPAIMKIGIVLLSKI